ncbi:hypothetical protein C0995_000661 [Termitomyces sp. Mi166|nr:hypothetical protein C0995_000661 [Termitomyces sp. Mi166\
MTTSRIPSKLDKEKESITVEVEENMRANVVDTLGLPQLGTPERLEAERKLVRKLDSRLLPTVVVIYIMNYIDRNGITTARLKGMQQDLGISDIQYATVIAILYASYCPAQIPSNMLIAAGILSNMEGKRGIRAWRWWLLPDYPHNTSWMSSYERRIALARISEDAGEADQDNAEDSPMRGLKMAISDPIVLIFTLQTISQLLGLSFVNFFPTPPWVFASIVCCLSAWHADRTGERFFHIAGWWWGVIVGFIIGLSTMKIPGRYVAMFLMASGYAGFAMNVVWVSNAVPRPPAYKFHGSVVDFTEPRFIDRKRAAAIGIVNGVGNLGNVIGSYTWKAAWGPEYHPSMAISLSALAFSTFLALVIRQMLIRKNKKLDEDENAALKDADRTRVEEAARLEGLTFEQAMERRKGYRYLY